MIPDNQVHRLMCRRIVLNAIILAICLIGSACGGGSGGDAGGNIPSETNADSSGNETSDIITDLEDVPEDQGGSPNLDCQMTSAEEKMLNQVNAARSQEWNCGSTPYASVAALKWDCKLQQASAGHSIDMADNNFFSHTGSNGLDPGFRIEKQGYQAQTWGENIAAGYVNIESAMTGWLQSPGHCRNIMDPNFTDLGMASAENPDSDFRIYWTQAFGTKATTSPQLPAQYQSRPQGRPSGNDLYRYPVLR